MLAAMFCTNGCCCFWIPLLFILGAANVLQSCENYEPQAWAGRYIYTRRLKRFQGLLYVGNCTAPSLQWFCCESLGLYLKVNRMAELFAAAIDSDINSGSLHDVDEDLSPGPHVPSRKTGGFPALP